MCACVCMCACICVCTCVCVEGLDVKGVRLVIVISLLFF